MNKVLATDLDGTLFYPKGRKRCIPKKNVKFLQDFIDDGNRLVLVTSRSTQFMERLKSEIERPYDMMTCTSSQIYHNDELIRDVPMDTQGLEEVINFLDNEHRPIAYLMTTDEYPCLIKQNVPLGKFLLWAYRRYYKHQRCYQEPYVISNELFDEQLKNNKVYKVMVFYGLGRNNKKISKK